MSNKAILLLDIRVKHKYDICFLIKIILAFWGVKW